MELERGTELLLRACHGHVPHDWEEHFNVARSDISVAGSILRRRS